MRREELLLKRWCHWNLGRKAEGRRSQWSKVKLCSWKGEPSWIKIGPLFYSVEQIWVSSSLPAVVSYLHTFAMAFWWVAGMALFDFRVGPQEGVGVMWAQAWSQLVRLGFPSCAPAFCPGKNKPQVRADPGETGDVWRSSKPSPHIGAKPSQAPPTSVAKPGQLTDIWEKRTLFVDYTEFSCGCLLCSKPDYCTQQGCHWTHEGGMPTLLWIDSQV